MSRHGEDVDPAEFASRWVEMFHAEYLARAGYRFDEMSDGETFFCNYGDTPHEAVVRMIEKYDLTDVTAGRTVFYVVLDDEGAWITENDPGSDVVVYVGTDKFEAECVLAKHCEGG